MRIVPSKVRWSNVIIKSSGLPTDVLTSMVYEPESNDYVIGPPDTDRAAGLIDIAMPS
ncbi:MAG: hypothetical protein ACYCZO_09790 [Daejeonella sp.]